MSLPSLLLGGAALLLAGGSALAQSFGFDKTRYLAAPLLLLIPLFLLSGWRDSSR
jgi:hypothetical protein